jgi:DNA modification methylase
VTGERIRDKIAASKKKGMWMGGPVPLGCDLAKRQLVINPSEAETVRSIFARYLTLKSVTDLQIELEHSGVRTKQRITSSGREVGGIVLCRGALYHLLGNPLYVGKTAHKGQLYDGIHQAIIDQETWDRTRELLRENTVKRRRRKNLRFGRMLHGKLPSEDERLYTPTHSAKGGRRYFYYTLLDVNDKGISPSIRRLPAAEIEARVMDSLGSFLEDERLMRGVKSDLVITDPPYNVVIDGHATGNGSIHHREFAMASGEMSSTEFTNFLRQAMVAARNYSHAGTLAYYFMDFRHMREILSAGHEVYTELLNLCVWAKSNGGMGSFYRSAHELVFLFKNGTGSHRNNVQLGKYGRYRTNVWNYPGANTFSHSDEGNLLALHPTPKPVALIEDAIKDCTARGDLILDPFLGSGTAVIEAEGSGRRCYGLDRFT